jgi:hypothetical protein
VSLTDALGTLAVIEAITAAATNGTRVVPQTAMEQAT